MRRRPSALIVFFVMAAAGSVGATDPVLVDADCDTGRAFSIATIGSRPAIAYRCAPNFQVRFVIAQDPRGDQWSTPVVVDDSCTYGYSTSLAEVDGRPAIAYNDQNLGGTSGTLRYLRADDALGASWPSPTTVDSGVFPYVDLAIVAGRPAVAASTDAGAVIYARSNDSTGATWPVPSTVGDGTAASLLSFGPVPAIGYLGGGSGQVTYRRALDAAGSAWGLPVVIAPTSSTSNLQFTEVSGYPAACWREGYELHYVRATAADGSTWGAAQTLVDTTNDPSFAVIGGVPAISYASQGTWFVDATDTTGESWSLPVPVTSGSVHRDPRLIEAEGLPALSFYDLLREELFFVRADTIDFSSMYVHPSTADFGYVEVGRTAEVQISVTNYRDATVEFLDSTTVGEDARRFRAAAGDAPFTLGPGESRFMTLEFHAAPPGEKHAVLELETDDPVFPTVNVPLQGWANNCHFEAITDDSGADLPHIMITAAANGRAIAFASDFDLLPGQNTDLNREIFVWEKGAGLQQVTDTTGIVNNYPAISNDGHSVVFESSADLVAGSNIDGSRELFLVELSNGHLTQITDGSGVSFLAPTVSDGGETVSCISNADFGSNADGSWEVFLLDVQSGTFAQVTDTNGSTNWSAQLSGSGDTLFFLSRLDVVPGSNADGNYEIFMYREGSGTTQITDTVGGSNGRPSVDQNGRHVVFLSSCDLVPGGNVDGNDEVFLWDAAEGFAQITATTGYAPMHSPSINDAGNRIVFVAEAELIEGLNHDLSEEIFLFDVATGLLSQVTYLPAGGYIYPAEIGGARIQVAFGSTVNVVGDSPSTGFDVYLATCGLGFDNFMSGDLRHWETGDSPLPVIDEP